MNQTQKTQTGTKSTTDNQSHYILSTARDRVWVVTASGWDEAREEVERQHDLDPDENLRLYEEGTLDDVENTLERDGFALLNP